jgi:hypothetical protein
MGIKTPVKLDKKSFAESNANATLLDLAGWNKLKECTGCCVVGFGAEPLAPGIESLEIKLILFAECGSTHAALGLVLDEPLPLRDTLFSGHGTPSQSLSMDCLGYHSWPEARCKGGLL